MKRNRLNLFFLNILKITILILILILTVSFKAKPIKNNKNYITFNDIITNEDNYKETNKKLIALTFDDGPDKNKTSYLIKELEKRNAHVSFFMVGERLESNRYLIKEISNAGHTIGSHTYNHKNLKNLKEEQVKYEINETNKILEDILNKPIKFLRPPYGNYNEYVYDSNMTIILWSIDTEDWHYKDANKIKEKIISEAKDGAIVLLHDLYNTSIEGALLAIDELKDEYRFVSLDELISIKKINVQPNEVYHNFS